MYNKQKWSMNEHGFSTSHIISKKERKSRKRHKFKLMKPWKNIMTFHSGERHTKNQQRRKEREQNHIQQKPCICLITISKAIREHYNFFFIHTSFLELQHIKFVVHIWLSFMKKLDVKNILDRFLHSKHKEIFLICGQECTYIHTLQT